MNRYEAYLPILQASLRKLDDWRTQFGEEELVGYTETPQIINIVEKLQERLEGNYPFHHPQYAGQMLKPPHPLAWISYALSMTINPNNHALDGGPPTSEMEKEAVSQLAEMVGYGEEYLGHLTSGGTIANLEALFIARELQPGKMIAASSRAHYTHKRMCRVLNTPFYEIPEKNDGSVDWDLLNKHIDKIGTLVVTMGTTGLGEVEPLARLLPKMKDAGVRVHADAAYGGFFKIIEEQLDSKENWKVLSEADSIVIDPHKHGLQPYGCGSVLYKDPSVGKFFRHDSPYTYFTSDDLHLGEISLECSRAGASAAALWATQQLFPLTEDGLGVYLKSTKGAANLLYKALNSSDEFECFNNPELDILGYFPVPCDRKMSEITTLSRKLFSAGVKAAPKDGFHLSLYNMNAHAFSATFPDYEADTDTVTILRSVMMKPEHELFITKLTKRLHTTLDLCRS
ncbi:aminotransferase class V-fold PLP-dependent enzyme [soil metagenome]